jgi:four helix bundle protein
MPNMFEKLPFFKAAHPFVLSVYTLTKNYPQDEKFALVNQLRRASSSIIANVIEGNSRTHPKEVLQFLFIAKGSLEESRYFLLLSKDLSYISQKDYDKTFEQTENIGRQLSGLIKYWNDKKD